MVSEKVLGEHFKGTLWHDSPPFPIVDSIVLFVGWRAGWDGELPQMRRDDIRACKKAPVKQVSKSHGVTGKLVKCQK